MRSLAICLTVVAALAGCGRGPQDGVTAVPGHGAIAIQVVPNPIIAKQVSGNTYDFPFDLVVRETAGRPVNVTRVSIRVVFAGGIPIHEEAWDTAQIRAMGYNPAVAGRTEVRYRFNPRKEVPDDRLFSGVSAELRVEAVDDTGAATSASTSVTVRR
jgi:hypothetical protein